MKAAVWHDKLDVRVEDVPAPAALSPSSVRVRVEWCGLCGTDVQEYLAGPVMITRAAHPLTGQKPPISLGHEMSGVVAELGSQVDGLEVGDLVVADACWRCGSCEWCESGSYNICPLGGSLGLHSDGALAESVDLPSYMLYKVPNGIPSDLAALAEPLAVAVHAVRRSGLEIGDSVAVWGAGPMGCAVVLVALDAGAKSIFVIDPNSDRCNQAVELGASAAFSPDDARAGLYEATDHRGVDRSFECSGADVADPAVRCLRRGGTMTAVGIHKDPVEIDLRRLVLFERNIVGALGYANEVPQALEVIGRNLGRLDRLVSRRIRLADVVEEGLAELANPDSECLKIMVSPG